MKKFSFCIPGHYDSWILLFLDTIFPENFSWKLFLDNWNILQLWAVMPGSRPGLFKYWVSLPGIITGLVTITDTAISVTHTSSSLWPPTWAWSPPSCPWCSPAPRCSCGWGVWVTCPAPVCSVLSHCRFPLCSKCGHSGQGSSGRRGGEWGGGWRRGGGELDYRYAWSMGLRRDWKIFILFCSSPDLFCLWLCGCVGRCVGGENQTVTEPCSVQLRPP